MNHFLKVIELYGIKPSFTINGHAQYTNLLDHLLSLITIIIILVFGCYFFSDLFTKNNPHITSSENNDIFPPKIYLNNEDFIIATGLQDEKYINYINENIYTVNLTLWKSFDRIKQYDKSTFQSQQIEMTQCDKVYMPILTNYFSRLPKSKLYCIKNTSEL